MKNKIFAGLCSMLIVCFFAFKSAKPTLYIIGDSTVKNGSGKGVEAMWGWGSVIDEGFDTTRIHLENHAIGGRSSRTFLSEGRWDKIMANLKEGDYVIMQFGHNDAGAVNDTSRARGTIRGLGEETQEIDNMLTKKHEIVHSFGWYMRKYVDDTHSKGATAIVCSLVPRTNWKDGKVQRSADSYSLWAEETAKSKGAFFINLNEKIAQKYELENEANVKANYFTNKDNTHTNLAGAKLNAQTVLEGIKGLDKCKLKKFLVTEKQIEKRKNEVSILETGSVSPMPNAWIDKDTGHKILRLSSVEGNNLSFYFHNNPFLANKDGDLMAFYNRTPEGQMLYSVNLKTLENKPLTNRSRIGGEIFAPKRGELFFQRKDSVFATSIITQKTRFVYVFPADFKGTISTVNSDEKILAGAAKEGNTEKEILKNFPEKKDFFDRIFDAKILNTLFTLNIETGELKQIHHENTWLGHIQFVPQNPNMLMFCHEGPWHKLDRMWTIDINTQQPKLMHKRSVDMEIAGHEFPSWDGKTIWFDLQIPKGQTFYLAGTNIETGVEKRYEMQRDEWSIHFNISPDQTLFAGDGGDIGQVAKAKNGQWIYLFRPEGDKLKSEKLVNMKHHGYKFEPNVHFSPDGKWIIFRANFEGKEQIYAAEIAKK